MSPSIALAESEIAWMMGGQISHKTQELDQLLDSELSFKVVSLTARAGYRDFYAAVNLSQSFDDADVSEEGETGDASREDYDITLGWNITPEFTVFGGYKTGETEIDFKARDSVIEDAEGDITAAFTDTFEESGLFVGVGYGISLGTAGQLGFSIAYADMDADNDLTGTPDEGDMDEEDDVDFDDLTGTFSGDVSGYSAAAQWSIPLSDSLVYQAIIRYNSYEQEIDDTVQGVKVSFDVDERFYEMGMGLLYVF
ncbi:hypothetical protein [Oceanicoccus sagamiensis]|uniref:Outer membrane protein beta-barrel domain-containing protein n=1 Tax=Oceanicoccus sagamiensis TaxID=716816 RepID=A0A1X9NCZ5_9GAMM|nr:hypothetical protein [Oceanicoccus sagamiensis]ARN73399.1 hypothetical protein BST96_04300 [Oceanicoccus sagamiensis]